MTSITTKERADSMAEWILRRAPHLKRYNIARMLHDMLEEQMLDDKSKAIRAHCERCSIYKTCVKTGNDFCPDVEYINNKMD